LPPPAPSIHLFGDKWLIKRFFIKQTKRARAQVFYADEGWTSTKLESPSFILPLDGSRYLKA